MRILGVRSGSVLAPILGLLLALALLPVLAAPANAATVAVTGTVTGKNAAGATVPIEGVFVELNDASGSPLEPRVYDYTAADGTYSLQLPATGTYTFVAECWGDYACADEYAPDPRLVRAFTAPTVLDATLERWGRITGTVTKNGAPTGWPAGVLSVDNDPRADWKEFQAGTIGANGSFVLDKVAPGTVAINGRDETAPPSLSTVDGQTFQIAPGTTTNIQLKIQDWAGVYSRAVDGAGNPLSGMTWYVFSRPVGGQWDAGPQFGPRETGADGRMRYRIADAEKGLEYTVCFSDETTTVPADRRLTRCLGDSADKNGATVWKFTAAQPVLNQDVVMPRAFTATPTPTISGTAVVDATLTANPGTWTPAPATTTYQWLRAGAPISGATSKTYVVQPGDLGKRISVQVTGTKPDYTPVMKTSSETAAVAAAAFENVPTPTVSGTAKVGRTLTADAGTWVPAATDTSYQWFRSGEPIEGAIASTYDLTVADLGETLTVRVTGASDGYGPTDATSPATRKVATGEFAKTPKPRIDGKAKVRATLQAVLGTWQPTPAATTYKWYRSGKLIKGATKRTYKLTKADKGKRIRVEVKQKLTGYVTTTVKSAPTKRIR